MRSTYFPGSSLLHRLHPLTKIVAAALVIAAAYLVPWLLAPLVLFAVLLLLAYVSGVSGPFLGTALRILLPITISLFLIQGLLFPPPGSTPLPLGPITLRREGLEFAFLTSTRLLTFTGT